MGTFTRTLRILHAKADGKFLDIDALVDTGAFYSWIPKEQLEALGYAPSGRRPFQIATGQVVERDLCEVRVSLGVDTRHTICVFGDSGSMPLLGAYTLEGFALAVDPTRKELTPLPVLPAM